MKIIWKDCVVGFFKIYVKAQNYYNHEQLELSPYNIMFSVVTSIKCF